MKTIRQFILDTLLPYKEDRSTCAIDKETKFCMYLTDDGRKCAVGKHMKEGSWQQYTGDAITLLNKFTACEILKEEAFNMDISDEGWKLIQLYHDNLSLNRVAQTNKYVRALEGYFETDLEELIIEL